MLEHSDEQLASTWPEIGFNLAPIWIQVGLSLPPLDTNLTPLAYHWYAKLAQLYRVGLAPPSIVNSYMFIVHHRQHHLHHHHYHHFLFH
eukprot:11511378-Karenia_brevis.AAC.1